MAEGRQLFGRRARIVIHRLVLEDLDIAFDVEKSLKRDPNTAEIRITNLNADHRRQLQEQAVVPLRLEAGYAKAQLSTST